MIKGRDILVWLSIKYEGDWNSIYQAIKNKELVDEEQVTKSINDVSDKYVTIIDEDYPEKLKKIYKPPFVLYYKGDLDLINQTNLAISGNYEASEYTSNLLDKLLRDTSKKLKDVGIAVNSFDGYEEKINPYYNKKFIVVLPNAINNYSKEFIFRNGLMITEYPQNTKFNEANVPWSHRLLAGISDGVLVTEMKKKSQTLILVGYSLYLNKSVGVFPQQDKDATTQLAKDGAAIVSTVDEVKQLLQSKPNNTEPVEVPTHA
jgi:DNA processing protein